VVEAHLAACPECTAFLAELAAVDEAAASLPAEPPAGYFDGFPARVRARLEPPHTASRGRRVPAWTWAAAAALLLAVVTPLTLRQIRPTPTAFVPPGPVPEPKRAEEARQPEAPSTPAFRPEPRGKGGPAPAASPVALPPAPAVARAPVPAAAPPEKAEADFAREPAPLLPAPAEAVVARDADARAPAGNMAEESVTARAGERLRVATAESAAQSTAPGLSAGKARPAGGALVEAPSEAAFRQLETARPRSAAEWRGLREAWNAFAASQPDHPRADEARVRAIVAGREAWLSSGSTDDETAFRRDAAGYLERNDALQKDRVKRLLAERRQP
jgi:hypothetical protein